MRVDVALDAMVNIVVTSENDELVVKIMRKLTLALAQCENEEDVLISVEQEYDDGDDN